MNDIKSLLIKGKNLLKTKNLDTYSIDATLLLMEVLNLSKIELITMCNKKVSKEEEDKYYKLINRRIGYEPVKYILKNTEFMGLPFYVDNNVLIPRPDTECLVEEVIDYINKNNIKKVIDMCTGSGCIAISLSHFCKSIEQIIAVDISEKALEIAKINANKNNIKNIKFVESNMFLNIKSSYKVDAIVSNPPYIPSEDINFLDYDVKNFEPIIALDGKEDGLYFYLDIAKNSKKYLNKSGKIFLEIGYDQKNAVKKIFLDENYKNIQTKKDLAGLDRIIVVDT